jgi:hypothetical protein
MLHFSLDIKGLIFVHSYIITNITIGGGGGGGGGQGGGGGSHGVEWTAGAAGGTKKQRETG